MLSLLFGMNEEQQDAGVAAAPQKVYVPTNIPFPAKLDLHGNIATNWRHFKRVWENYKIEWIEGEKRGIESGNIVDMHGRRGVISV